MQPDNHTPSSHRAIMAQRLEADDSLELFPTPPWATRAFIHAMAGSSPTSKSMTVLEPAAGLGHMAEVLAEHFAEVHCSDVFDYGLGHTIEDYADCESYKVAAYDWVITNPPFTKAVAFLDRAMKEARRGVAMLVRTTWLEGAERHKLVFSKRAPSVIFQYSERVPMHKGVWLPDGSTATSYCWCVWLIRDGKLESDGQTSNFKWIKPGQRKALTTDADIERWKDVRWDFPGDENFPTEVAVETVQATPKPTPEPTIEKPKRQYRRKVEKPAPQAIPVLAPAAENEDEMMEMQF